MKFNLLVATSQINSEVGRQLGIGSTEGLRHLAEIIVACGFEGDIYDLPNGARDPNKASPFSLNSGFALTTDELNVFNIPELSLDRDFLSEIKQLNSIHQQYYAKNRTVSYTLKRTLLPWILEKCFVLFKQDQSDQRIKEFFRFQELASYWLEEYAIYETYKEQKIDLTTNDYDHCASSAATQFRNTTKNRIEFHKYVQFLCYEQRKKIHTVLTSFNLGLIVNLPFGVEFDSADVHFHPEVFDAGVQVGCSPEPEHGYPEQAWGVAVYKEQSPGLQQYLEEKMLWLSQFGDGVFLDHLVGWCGQYVIPQEIPQSSNYPYGHFLTENHLQRKENISWFLNIIAKSGLTIRGEVAGDAARVKATREVIEEFKNQGRNISTMIIPRWETKDDTLVPLSCYDPATLMMAETHDTSTLLQYLLNRKGYFDDFESPSRILEFCNRVLGLPFLTNDVPLTTTDCSDGFWFEICKRLSEGAPSEDVVFTLSGLISLLSKQHRSPTIENNINIKPGTSGAVGNGWRNWSYFSPPVETISLDPLLKQALIRLAKRRHNPFDYFHSHDSEDLSALNLEIRYSNPNGRAIIYKDRQGVWAILPLATETINNLIDLELVIRNAGEEEIWHHIELDSLINLDESGTVYFQDLNGERGCYSYTIKQLKEDKLFVKLQPGQVHHFLVYQHHKKIVVSFAE